MKTKNVKTFTEKNNNLFVWNETFFQFLIIAYIATASIVIYYIGNIIYLLSNHAIVLFNNNDYTLFASIAIVDSILWILQHVTDDKLKANSPIMDWIKRNRIAPDSYFTFDTISEILDYPVYKINYRIDRSIYTVKVQMKTVPKRRRK